jgi:hypothetical protein
MTFDPEINEFWRENEDLRGEYLPRFYGDVQPRRFLSVGMNPSLPRRCPDFLAPILTEHNLKYPDCYKWHRSGLAGGFVADIAAQFTEWHEHAVNNYAFFRRPRQMAQAFGQTDLQHADLFLCMSPSLRGLLRNHRFCKNREFVQHQLNLSLRIIRAYQPEIILFVYAAASDIFLRFLMSQQEAPPQRPTFEWFGNTRVSWGKVDLVPGQSTFCIRWPSLPKSSRGSMSDEQFTGLLPNLIAELNRRNPNE